MSLAKLLAAHGGDLESLKSEMQATEVMDFVARHQLVDRNAAVVAELKLGVRCLRRCVACGQLVPADQLRRKQDGRLSNRCARPECDEDPRVLAAKAKQRAKGGSNSTRAALLAEYLAVPAAAYAEARRPWCRRTAGMPPTFRLQANIGRAA